MGARKKSVTRKTECCRKKKIEENSGILHAAILPRWMAEIYHNSRSIYFAQYTYLSRAVISSSLCDVNPEHLVNFYSKF